MSLAEFRKLKPGDEVLVRCDNMWNWSCGYLAAIVLKIEGVRAVVRIHGNGHVLPIRYSRIKRKEGATLTSK